MSARYKETRGLEPQVLNPCVVVLSGPTLSGKTSTALVLAEGTNLTPYDADDYRRKLFLTAGANPRERKPYGEEVVIQKAAYRGIHGDVGKRLIANGEPAVISASYSKGYYRDGLRELVGRIGVPVFVFSLTCPEDAIASRLEARRTGNDASSVKDVEQVRFQMERFVPISTAEFPVTHIGLTNSPQETANIVRRHLGEMMR